MSAAKRYARYRWEIYGLIGRLRSAELTLQHITRATDHRPHSRDLADPISQTAIALVTLRSALNNHLKLLQSTNTWKQL